MSSFKKSASPSIIALPERTGSSISNALLGRFRCISNSNITFPFTWLAWMILLRDNENFVPLNGCENVIT